MQAIKFTKLSGNGNDFIVIDNRKKNIRLSARQIAAVCTRRFSAGADGLIMLEPAKKPYNFYMRFYNNDGREAEMCGNGGRCVARFAYLNGIAPAKMRFLAKDGPHEAAVLAGGIVKLKMIEPFDIRQGKKVNVSGKTYAGTYLNTGVPHFVAPVADVERVDVRGTGRKLRFHKAFGPKGANVNFVQRHGSAWKLRTYERGVEDETCACGTGAVASAIALYLAGKAKPPVKLQARGGVLKVYFKETGHCGIREVWLEGNARVVYKGILTTEAYKF